MAHHSRINSKPCLSASSLTCMESDFRTAMTIRGGAANGMGSGFVRAEVLQYDETNIRIWR